MQPVAAAASKQVMFSAVPSSSSGTTLRDPRHPQGVYVAPAPAGQILLSRFLPLKFKKKFVVIT